MGLKRFFKNVGKATVTPITVPVRAAKRGVEKTMQATIFGVIRHLLSTLGGGLISSGLLSSDDLNAAIGAIMTLIGIAWSIASKRKKA